MKCLRTTVLVALFTTLPIGSAQLLGEVTLTTAIASSLYPGVYFPTGSLRAEGPGATRFVASLQGADASLSWEVFTATGLAARLKPVFVREIANAFAVAGLFESGRTERVVGDATHVRYVFSDGAEEAVLWVVSDATSVVWAVGR